MKDDVPLTKTTFGINVRCYITLEHPSRLSGPQLEALVRESVPEGATYTYEIEGDREVKVEFGSATDDDPDIVVIESDDPELD
jgi:hypothetical protein